MIVKPSESVTIDFTTQTAATGALTDADSLPTGTLSRNGTDDGAVTVTVTNKAGGRYKAAFTVPADYAAGDDLSLYIAATVATIAGGGVVWRGIVDTKRVSDLNDAAAAPTAVAIRQEIDSNSTQLAAILEDTGTTIPATLTTIAQYLDTEIAAILEDTGTTLPATLAAMAGATFDTATDSLEALRNRGDAAWVSGSLTILPFVTATLNSGDVTFVRLTAYQYCRIQATFAVTDQDGNAVDLSAKVLAITAWPENQPGTTTFELRSDGDSPEITVSGASNNQVTIDADDSRTADAAILSWRLYDVTSDVALVDGRLTIKAGTAPSE